jgi:hypothetical protein
LPTDKLVILLAVIALTAAFAAWFWQWRQSVAASGVLAAGQGFTFDFSQRPLWRRLISRSRVSGKETGIPGLESVDFIFGNPYMVVRRVRPGEILINGVPLEEEERALLSGAQLKSGPRSVTYQRR